MGPKAKRLLEGIKIKLQPRQALFDFLIENGLSSWLGYGGARGGAKSGGARRFMLRRRLAYPGTRGVIIRRVWDDNYKNNVLPFFMDYPQLFQFYRDRDHAIELPNNSTIFFDSAEHRSDVKRKSVGPEFMDVMIDQAEQFEEQELKDLKTICRWPNTPLHRCKFCLYFNPGGVGASFLQRIFYTKEYHENENEDDYAFVQAYGWDNVEWVRSVLEAEGFTDDDFYSWDSETRFNYFVTNSQYGQELNALDATMRPGQLLGQFDKFAGQYFANWDAAVHVWPSQNVIFQPWWRHWIAIDWGFAHWAAIGWFTQAGNFDPANDKKLPLTLTYRVMTRRRMSERALAEEIVANNQGDKISAIFGGHDLWKEESSGPSKEQAMSEVFMRHGLPRMKRASIDRVNGWRLMHRMLDEGEWIVTDNCKEVIRAIPTAVFNEKDAGKNEDVLKTTDQDDDVRDMLRYGLYSAYGPNEAPFDETVKDQTAHITDPTARAIQRTKIISAHRNALASAGMVNSRSASRYSRYMQRFR